MDLSSQGIPTNALLIERRPLAQGRAAPRSVPQLGGALRGKKIIRVRCQPTIFPINVTARACPLPKRKGVSDAVVPHLTSSRPSALASRVDVPPTGHLMGGGVHW